jgi:hypothetical protein
VAASLESPKSRDAVEESDATVERIRFAPAARPNLLSSCARLADAAALKRRSASIAAVCAVARAPSLV